MNKAVIYARYSSDNQREESIEGQIKVCEKYASQNNLKIIDTYIDRGISARTDKRPSFQLLMNDSYLGKFDVVLVYSLDRFSRDRYDSIKYTMLLNKNNIKLLSATEVITEDPSGIFMRAILEAQAEYYSLELSQKVKRGQLINLEKGKLIGGYLPYAYKRVDGYAKVVEHEANIVKLIYETFLQTLSFVETTNRINNLGFLNRDSEKFSVKQVRKILDTKQYTGEYMYQDKIFTNVYPQIICKDKFERVLEITKLNIRKRKIKDDRPYYLTGKLFYGKDLHAMTGTCGTSKSGKVYYYYQTIKKPKKTIRRDILEDIIAYTITNLIIDDEKLDILAEDIMKYYEKGMQDNTAYLDVLIKTRNDLNKELKKLVNAIKKGLFSKTVQNEIESTEKKIEALNKQIIEEQEKTTPLEYEMVIFTFYKLRESYSEKEFKHIIFEHFLDNVFIINDTINVVCSLYPEATYSYSIKDISVRLDLLWQSLGNLKRTYYFMDYFIVFVMPLTERI